jgi:hypothetical protein
MIIIDNQGYFQKGRIWLNDYPNIQFDAIEILHGDIFEINDKTWKEKTVCLEMLFLRHASNYGLLGIKFIPKPIDHIELEVFISKDNENLFYDSLAKNDKVHVGLPKQYAVAVFKIANEILQKRILPPGKLIIDIASHAEIGSSRLIFSQIITILFKIIVNEITDIKIEDVRRIIFEEIDKM